MIEHGKVLAKRLALMYHEELTKSGHPNIDKIVTLFSHWFLLFYVAKLYNYKFTQETLDIYGLIIEQDGCPPKLVRTKSWPQFFMSLIKKLIIKLIVFANFFPFKSHYLAGASISRFGRINILLTFEKIKLLNPQFEKLERQRFIGLCLPKLPEKLRRDFQVAFPRHFFQTVKSTIKFRKTFIGVPSLFIGSETYVSLLFVTQKFYFVGLQHGGGYGEFKNSIDETFDLNFSNDYYYWGLGQKNIIQNRFSITAGRAMKISSAKIVLNYSSNGFSAAINGTHSYCGDVINNRSNLFGRLSNIIKTNYMMHPNSKTGLSNADYITYKDLKEVDIYSTLFILDSLGHTFMYKAIYQQIPFIFYLDRTLRHFLSPQFLSFLDYLEQLGLIFYWGQEELLLGFIQDLKYRDGFSRMNFSRMRSFLEVIKYGSHERG